MPGAGQRLLIIEGQTLLALSIATIARRLNFDVVGSVTTAQRAMELVDDWEPSVVLLDLNLADGSDGVATAQAIGERCAAHIMFLTATSDENLIVRMRSVTPAGIILKPFHHTELTSKLTALARSLRVMAREGAEDVAS